MSNAEKEFDCWLKEISKTYEVPNVPFMLDQFKLAFTAGVEAGRAAMLAEIKNRMPTDEALNYKMTYEMGRLSVIGWLKTKLFGGDV